jgi:tetratricopeptide (TPR) repeat protein
MVRRAVLVVCLLFSAVATAQKLTPKAQEKYNQGKISYDVGEFDAAIAAWKEGYKLSSEPIFLYNIAQAYRHAGNINQALFFYRSYLRNAPDAANRKIAEDRIDELERLQAQEPKDPGRETPAKDPTPPDRPTVVAPPGPPPPPPPPGRGKRLAGLATAGAGVALVGLGSFFLLDASSRGGELEAAADRHDPWTAATAAELDAVNSRRTLGTVVTVVGVAAVAGGGVLYYLGRKAGREVNVAPAVSDEGAAVLVWGTF